VQLPNFAPTKSQVNMPAEILTTDDLREFKVELIEEFKRLISLVQASNYTPTKKLLKSSEVQELLDLSPNSLRNLRVSRVLPFTKINGTIYYDRSDIDQMISRFKKPARVKP
jgi:phage regulator Rha-like protein